MPNTVVVGAQWGDEAKGKLVDHLARSAEMVVRFGGGNNAGHTVEVAGQTYKFHLVPCGILHEGVECVLSDGVVIDPEVLVKEIGGLISQGVNVSRLRISANAHVIMPYHRLLDQLDEARRGSTAIGTTGRGIGPCYADKAARSGIRMHELVDSAKFEFRAGDQFSWKNELITKVYGHEALSPKEELARLTTAAERLKPFVTCTAPLVAEAAARGRVVFEGAQGTLLDLDLGTYPFVTSSHPISGGACIGTGVGPTQIHEVIGVAKSYTTRVGAGVFPTELDNETGDWIRERGREFGTTTGRPRRCGWIDTVILRYAAQVNGLTGLSLGHLDVLSGLDEVQIGIAYRHNGVETRSLPTDLVNATGLETVYESAPGWREDVSEARTVDDLPTACRAYVSRIQQLVGVPIRSLSVGPGREQLVHCRPGDLD